MVHLSENCRVAVVIPCHNEQATIGKVVSDFRRALPAAAIFVCDNLSSDSTAAAAAAAGSVVMNEILKGKGNAVRRLFADVDADVYVLVDGDDTYEAADAPLLIAQLLDGGLDMVNGRRVQAGADAYPIGHAFGNRVLSGLVGSVFGRQVTDMLSGYKVFSRRFVKSFPAFSCGFEIETELTVHALELRTRVVEVPTAYRQRPAGGESKLRTVRDGCLILKTILRLVKEERPLQLFAGVGAVLVLLSLLLGGSVLIEFLETGLVPRLPTAVLATGLTMVGMISFACGLILDTVTVGRRELKRLAFLQLAPNAPTRRSDTAGRWSEAGEPALAGHEQVGRGLLAAPVDTLADTHVVSFCP